MDALWAIVAIVVVAGIFVFFWYAVKRRLKARGRRELGLPAKPVEAVRVGGAARLPPTSLVLLSTHAQRLSRELVEAAVRRAWGVERLSDDETADAHWVFGQTEHLCTVSVKGTVYTIVSLAEPYTKDRDWYIGDETPAEMLSAWQRHRAWLSIDLVVPGTMIDLGEVMNQIGKLAAELADQGTIAVVRPATRHAVAFDEEVRQLLRRTPARDVVTGPLTALVVLQRHRWSLAERGGKWLAGRARTAWGGELSAIPSAGADFCAVSSENGGMGFMQWQGVRVGVRTPEGRYAPEGGALAEGAGEGELGAAWRTHEAWTSVELLGAPVGMTKRRVYEILGQLTATLAETEGVGALAIYAPGLRRALLSTGDALAKLRGDEAEWALLQGEPVGIERDAP